MTELLRPWKLITLGFGMSWLLHGAITNQFPDWDIGLSLLMGLYAYIVAPWCVRTLWQGQWSRLWLVALAFWFGVDGLYMWYLPPEASLPMRDANFVASSGLFWLCGVLWSLDGDYHG